MVKEISKERKKSLLSRYHKNENRNYHTENALMLINEFGTSVEKAKAKRLKRDIDKRDSVTYEESQWFLKHGHVHYAKLLD